MVRHIRPRASTDNRIQTNFADQKAADFGRMLRQDIATIGQNMAIAFAKSSGEQPDPNRGNAFTGRCGTREYETGTKGQAEWTPAEFIYQSSPRYHL
jgi:hypothetical protein